MYHEKKLCNIIDFKYNFYQNRYNIPFGYWHSKKIENPETCVICFNPNTMLSHMADMFSSEVFYILINQNCNSDTQMDIFRMLMSVNPSNIMLCYDNTYYNSKVELIKLIEFFIAYMNFSKGFNITSSYNAVSYTHLQSTPRFPRPPTSSGYYLALRQRRGK